MRAASKPVRQVVMIIKVVLGVLAGGLLGFGYYKLIGCPTGGCPLTSNPWTSTLYGMVVGALVASSFN
jgi:hypothetical protein